MLFGADVLRGSPFLMAVVVALLSLSLLCSLSCASSAQLLEPVSAEQVMACANGSAALFDRVFISGDLVLGPQFHGPLRITNSVIEGNVSCKGTTFSSPVDFENTTFSKAAIFNSSRFLGCANFNATSFMGPTSFNLSRFPESGTFDFVRFLELADFSGVSFDTFATFYMADFQGDALFSFSEFDGAYANFESTSFSGFVDFSGCQFNSYGTFAYDIFLDSSDFHGSKFSNGANFLGSQFFAAADFSRTHFIEDSFFNQMTFNGSALISNAKFDGPAFFNDTIFRRDADFDNARFMASTDMSNALFEGDLSLNSSAISGMVLEGSRFSDGSRLYLNHANFDRLMVDWIEIKEIINFDSSAYLALIKNYKELGRSSDANECYYEYRYLNQVRKPVGFSRLLDTVAWLTCGYGVRPHYALFCGAFLILVFAFIYLTGRGVEGFGHIHGIELVGAALFYSTIAFTANSKGLPLKGRYKYIGIAEGIMGWLLMALFLVTLGRLIIG